VASTIRVKSIRRLGRSFKGRAYGNLREWSVRFHRQASVAAGNDA
jgi:hypothetical protein